MFKGVAVSPGVAIGVVHRVESVFGPAEPEYLAAGADPGAEISRFEQAVQRSAEELDKTIEKVATEVGAAEAEIFRSHLTVLQDATLLQQVKQKIRDERLTATSALHEVVQAYAAAFARLEHDHFRERLADIRDVIARIIGHLQEPDRSRPTEPTLSGEYDPSANGTTEPVVLVANEILPSQAMSLGHLPLAGIVTETGGSTSHAAILSRSRGIPAVSGCVGVTSALRNGEVIIVDGREGVVLVRPDAETLAAYRKIQREFVHIKDRLIRNRDEPAASRDGVRVELLANINTLSDAKAAVQVGATGVGLYRTEYLFITHPDVPNEEEQYQAYKAVVETAPNRSVTIRTLDLGGDKTVPYLGHRHEPNPFMGWRSIRLISEHPRLFETQVRAILRAGAHGKVSILFPMITTVDELKRVRQMVDGMKAELAAARVPFGRDVQFGVMIEVPAAAVCIDSILRDVDFISIGSNDLIQYLVAADRDNPKVAHLCDPLGPAILRVLKMILDACSKTGTPVTVCGEMAGQPRCVLVLFGMGLTRFSMSPAFVPTIKALLARVSTAEAERYAHHVLQAKTADEIRQYLNERLRDVSRDFEFLEIH
jgi:phosphoenolpyruvate-protein phosphotransferase